MRFGVPFIFKGIEFEEGELPQDSLVANYTTTAEDFSVFQNEGGGRATLSKMEIVAVVISKMETTTFCNYSAKSAHNHYVRSV